MYHFSGHKQVEQGDGIVPKAPWMEKGYGYNGGY
jgi:hypothetical protein